MGKRLPFLFLVLAVASSLLYMKACGAATQPTQPTTPKHSAKRLSCLEEMNAPRITVGFSKFQDPTEKSKKLPVVEVKLQSVESVLGRQTSARLQKTRQQEEAKEEITEAEQTDFLNAACNVIRGKTDDSSLSQVDNSKGIYMYASQASEDGDCAAAVLHWKSAINNFTELPPAYSTETPSPYTDPLNISFVGLYNPGQNPTVDCAVITCQPETQTGEGGPPSSKVGDGAEDETEKKEVYSLVCLSTPQALQASQKPFTQDQWNKIAGIQDNLAQPTKLAFMAFAVAALAHLIA